MLNNLKREKKDDGGGRKRNMYVSAMKRLMYEKVLGRCFYISAGVPALTHLEHKDRRWDTASLSTLGFFTFPDTGTTGKGTR